MTKFKFESFEDEYPKWAKHHEMVGLHVKRAYENGEESLTRDEELNKLVENHKEHLLSKQVNVYNRKEDKRLVVTDYFLPLKNQDYQKTVDYFSSGASNTTQKMGVRYKFLLDNSLFILEQFSNVNGSYNLLNLLDEDYLEESIRELAEKSNVKVDGISSVEGDTSSVSIVVVDEFGDADIIEIELKELLEHLISVDVFEYEIKIID